MMTLEEQKLAVCEKLPELIKFDSAVGAYIWKEGVFDASPFGDIINWPTEGLQVCHEAEKLLTGKQALQYADELNKVTKCFKHITPIVMCMATYEQRLEALCRVWWPERWS